ncbi:MAG TPA: TIGR03618 family F420-dependent PPOX class oxidoreductase [Dehalococcoidia bacterium]|nr:TIGR03618 family F420-dependent PPOX class oxidoreductase [Dehalococcoidia bacterium]
MPDAAGREAFLAQHRFCVLGTLRKDGRARLSPMAYLYEDGKIIISTTRTRGGGRTAKADPRVTVCIINLENRGEYLTVYGQAEVYEDEAMTLRLFEMFRRKKLEGAEREQAREEIHRDGRVILRITPQEFYPR